ncbi:hypothetical protein DMC30DRAFT_390687 [Rhodotorula diobovata]|uniref:S1 motif domain-containing protein n=1 Tax=Rhodotorula diobovata TaxID=5288 RepID=A0A5C5G1J4_9BASI|nr:hypothetical protein DMC30DRAFT_390687 [Rhodotorula diobovata]
MNGLGLRAVVQHAALERYRAGQKGRTKSRPLRNSSASRASVARVESRIQAASSLNLTKEAKRSTDKRAQDAQAREARVASRASERLSPACERQRPTCVQLCARVYVHSITPSSRSLGEEREDPVDGEGGGAEDPDGDEEVLEGLAGLELGERELRGRGSLLTGEHGLSGEFESKRWRTNPRDEARPGTHPHFALPSPHSYSTMATLVIPGQPLSTQGTGAQLAPGPGTFSRNGQLYASLVGEVIREQGVISVKGKEETQAIPEPNATVIGTVTRITRQAATLSLLTVDGRPCRPDFTGIIRAQDVRQTAKDSVKIWSCYRPGDVVRAKVISLGDSRSCAPPCPPPFRPQLCMAPDPHRPSSTPRADFLSTAANSLGVLFAVSSTTGEPLEAVSWEEMRDPSSDEREPRKVAGPE